jgi:hypothetical protein
MLPVVIRYDLYSGTKILFSRLTDIGKDICFDGHSQCSSAFLSLPSFVLQVAVNMLKGYIYV